MLIIITTQWRRKTSEDSFINIYTSHFICKGSKRLFKVCVWEGAGDRIETVIFWPPLWWPSTLCLSRSPDAQPEAQRPTLLGDGFLYCILSASSLDPNSSRPVRPDVALPTTSRPLPLQLSGTQTQLSYIIVQRPLDLWNRMFDRHQAEITVMQFTGHSLPVHQSMRVSWDFFSLADFISQFPPTRFSLLTANGMCHFLPVHHLGMAFLAGSKAKIQLLVRIILMIRSSETR